MPKVCVFVLALWTTAFAQSSRDLKVEKNSSIAGASRSWALVVGISSYKNVPPRAQLQFAHRDAEAVAAFLQSESGGRMPASHVHVLTDERATLARVRSELHTWLPQAAGPDDVVYLFFAGHGVIAEGEGYFVAHDSDPQNLHATGLAFKEVDRVLSDQIRAKQIVLLADACHAGSIGWTGDPSSPSRAAGVLESIGRGDRSILKLLASRSNEQSFEDGRWDGGHGVFTFALLRGLRGGADRDKDGNIRVAEIIEHISQVVPRETGSRQNPRVAGNFEPQLCLATFRDAGFMGPLPANLATTSATLAKLESLIRSGRVTGSGGAVEWYRSQKFDREEKPVADTILTSALEETGQACVNDYVQSTVMGLKRNMLRNAEEAYRELRALRPGDPTLVTKEGFCRARAEIAEAKYEQAAITLRGVLRLDPQFACAHNALGVALDRIGKREEAIASWERAAQLTPEWSLPFLQIAQQKISESRLEDALPWLEKAARYNPRSMAAQWNLLRAYRLLNRDAEFEKQSGVLIAANPNYAPAYLEIAQYFELKKEGARAADAYDMYAQLAPNFADTNQVRARSAQLRSQANRKVPSLKK